MHAPGLDVLFRREQSATSRRTAFCMAGCPELAGTLAEELKTKAKITAFVAALSDISSILGVLNETFISRGCVTHKGPH
jgi:hypothetical protein